MQDEKEIREKVHKALALVNMIGHDGKVPVALSGGMRKRVALARAIISPPSVILYDEPTAGLDPIVSDSINRLIRRLQGQLQVTSVVVTHDMVSAYRVGDRIAFLDHGRIYFCGSPQQLRLSSDPVIRNFVEGRSSESSETE
jgi:phospholipid/cholesterol/gamma-HCH transport system ATP-binding protein